MSEFQTTAPRSSQHHQSSQPLVAPDRKNRPPPNTSSRFPFLFNHHDSKFRQFAPHEHQPLLDRNVTITRRGEVDNGINSDSDDKNSDDKKLTPLLSRALLESDISIAEALETKRRNGSDNKKLEPLLPHALFELDISITDSHESEEINEEDDKKFLPTGDYIEIDIAPESPHAPSAPHANNVQATRCQPVCGIVPRSEKIDNSLGLLIGAVAGLIISGLPVGMIMRALDDEDPSHIRRMKTGFALVLLGIMAGIFVRKTAHAALDRCAIAAETKRLIDKQVGPHEQLDLIVRHAIEHPLNLYGLEHAIQRIEQLA